MVPTLKLAGVLLLLAGAACAIQPPDIHPFTRHADAANVAALRSAAKPWPSHAARDAFPAGVHRRAARLTSHQGRLRGTPAATPPGETAPLAPKRATPELAAGRFLIATRELTGPFFAESVVLLLEYRASGALGIVINRPTNVPLTQLLPELARLGHRTDRVYLGGPVEPELVVFLIRADASPPDAQPVIDDVYATGSAAALRQVVAENAPASRFHAYVGYAGWAPGQLDAEVARGDWYIADADPDHIFDDALGDLWQRLVQEHEGIQVRMPVRDTVARGGR